MCRPTAVATATNNEAPISEEPNYFMRNRNIDAPLKFDQVALPLADIYNAAHLSSPRTSSSNQDWVSGGSGYQLNDNDVICGRGKRILHHVGNIRFREICLERADQYRKAKTRVLKQKCVSEIILGIRSAGGRFLQHKAGEYQDISDEAAAAKVGHALRDAKNASSPCSKALKKARSTKVTRTNGWDQLLDDMFHPLDEDMSDLESVLRVTTEGSGILSFAA